MAGLAGVEQPREVAHRSLGTRVNDIEHRDPALVDGRAQARQVGIAIADDGEAEVAGAVHVGRIDGGDAKLGVGGLLLLGAPPRHMDVRRAAVALEILGEALEQVELLV